MKLKVKQLDWYMKELSPPELEDQGYVLVDPTFPLIGRDGHYCRGEDVWFEVAGVGYVEKKKSALHPPRRYFCYSLTVNDDAILPKREVEAMAEVLKTSRDASVKKALQQRLRLHTEAAQLRETRRSARRSARLGLMRFLGA